MSPAARRCVQALKEGRPAPPAVLERSSVHETPPSCSRRDTGRSCWRTSPRSRGAQRAQPGRGAVNEHARLPSIRADPFCVPDLDRFLSGSDVWLAPGALALLQEIREEHARAAGLVELSSATAGDLQVPGLGGELKPFQRAGVSYLLERRRTFLADEQGLGKTIEALAALEAAGAYPAVVVCPASLKLNWLREIERWLPGRTAQALSGTGSSGADGEAEITVVNYDIVAARLDELTGLGPQALVLDESHYCKNAAAKRTQAVQRLAAEVPPRGDGAGPDGNPRRQPPGGADLPAADPRAPLGLRVGREVRRALPRRRRAPAPALAPARPLLREAPEGRRAPAAAPEDPLDRPRRTRQRRRIPARGAGPHRVAAQPAARAGRARREGRRRAARRTAGPPERAEAARGTRQAARRADLDPRLPAPRGSAWSCSLITARSSCAILDSLPDSRCTSSAPTAMPREIRRSNAFQAARHPREPADRVLDRGRRPGIDADALLQAWLFLELDWMLAKHDQAEDRCHRIGQWSTR